MPETPYRAEFAGLWEQQDGYTDDPRQARADWGEEYLAAAAEAVARHLIEFHRASERMDDDGGPDLSRT